jgi:ketosteroid isomerase-like protein
MNLTHEQLADRAEIIEVTHRYAWALDSRQFEMLDDVFIPDARADLLMPTVLEGREAIVARISGALSRFQATQHLVGNHLITVDGDTATCRCYLQAQHVRSGVTEGSPNYLMGGHYEDELVRTAHGWRIAFRRLTITWTEGSTRRP